MAGFKQLSGLVVPHFWDAAKRGHGMRLFQNNFLQAITRVGFGKHLSMNGVIWM